MKPVGHRDHNEPKNWTIHLLINTADFLEARIQEKKGERNQNSEIMTYE